MAQKQAKFLIFPCVDWDDTFCDILESENLAKNTGFSFSSGSKKKTELLLGNGGVLTLGCY